MAMMLKESLWVTSFCARGLWHWSSIWPTPWGVKWSEAAVRTMEDLLDFPNDEGGTSPE